MGHPYATGAYTWLMCLKRPFHRKLSIALSVSHLGVGLGLCTALIPLIRQLLLRFLFWS